MYGWTGGFGDGPPLGPGMKDCGGGSSVRADLSCPVNVPLTAAQIAGASQAQADYDARKARCGVYQKKEYAIDIAVGLAVAFLAPGMWKLMAIPAAIITEAYFPRSVDCDYGW